ncbi:MAG: PLP-dependent aminotransferase family protein [Robinsoniella sp.]|nr:PLP-dependent aminotransferase family protein [Robinsoniella sp.]
MQLKLENTSDHLYTQVYQYYKDLILSGKLLSGSKMPSLRRCSRELEISRTTVESAYLQLAADGYIISRPQSGYYVTDIPQKQSVLPKSTASSAAPILYNFASSGVDRESFRFDIWRRYIKSALRQDERLLSYGEPQGEREFREVLASYIRTRRNILCSPDDIVVGAGTQSLLHILCPLLKERHTVSFPNPSFLQGISVFEDYGFDVHYRDKDCDIIYVSPAHMTKWGDLMPVSRRLELVHYAAAHGSLILEDDFENEFVYLQKPTPSLQSLAGGQGVVYIGSFSRLLLPSIRISFMVLTSDLADRYRLIANHYNQTASKTEQIALCQFIRDGHLAAQTRKLKRLYASKLKSLLSAVRKVFGKDASIQIGSGGISLALRLPCPVPGKTFVTEAKKRGVLVELLKEEPGFIELILSCSTMPSDQFLPGCQCLYEILESLTVTHKE